MLGFFPTCMEEKTHSTPRPILRVLNNENKRAYSPSCSVLSGSERTEVRKEGQAHTPPPSRSLNASPLAGVGPFIICSLSTNKVAGARFPNPEPSSGSFSLMLGAEPKGSLAFPYGESLAQPITHGSGFVFFCVSHK